MARKFQTDKNVVIIIDKLSRLYSGPKSRNGLSKILSNNEETSLFHPNRLNGLLDGNKNGAINDKTFDAVSKRLNEIDINTFEDIEYQNKIIQNFSTKTQTGEKESLILEAISSKYKVPLGVINSYCKNSLISQKKSSHIIPDWSWQEKAIERTLQSLISNKKTRTALIIPTGGGKTRIATEVIYRLIADNQILKAVWVVDKIAPLAQAEKTFEETINRTKISLLEKKEIKKKLTFMMVKKASDKVSELEKSYDMLIIDEAHHAAANSYRPLILSKIFTTLLLTATPNRTDGGDIGIDQIAFQVTPKYLFDKKCIIKPELEIFESTISESVFDTKGTIKEFAIKILNDARVRFNKSLICILEKTNVEALYQELQDQLLFQENHKLLAEDIHYAHGSGNSKKIKNNDFFLKFEKEIDHGILIATGGLVSEGLDIPSLDSVYISYNSESIINLLQTSGRALRYSKGKTKATIVQVKSNDLQYYFNSAWLYQDISDKLRPQIIDIKYSNNTELKEKISKNLENKSMETNYKNGLCNQIENLQTSQNARIILVGINYMKSRKDFERNSKWRPFFIKEDEDVDFVNFFNEISFSPIINDPTSYSNSMLNKYPFIKDISLVKDFVYATNGAKKEMLNDISPNREYKIDLGTSWLINLSISFYDENLELSLFLDNCLNKSEILTLYKKNKKPHAIKIKNPISNFFAILLDEEEYSWILNYRTSLLQKLINDNKKLPWEMIEIYNFQLEYCPLPQWILPRLYQILNEEDFINLTISL